MTVLHHTYVTKYVSTLSLHFGWIAKDFQGCSMWLTPFFRPSIDRQRCARILFPLPSICHLFVHILLFTTPNIFQKPSDCGSAHLYTVKSTITLDFTAPVMCDRPLWNTPGCLESDPPHYKQLYLFFLVEVEIFKPTHHMKHSVG